MKTANFPKLLAAMIALVATTPDTNIVVADPRPNQTMAVPFVTGLLGAYFDGDRSLPDCLNKRRRELDYHPG